MTSSEVRPWRSNGAGRVGNGCVGDVRSPGTSDGGTARSSRGQIGSPVDKFILYCYRYDAQEGRYAPVAMQIMRVGGGLAVLFVGALLLAFWMRDLRLRKKRLA